MTSGNGVRKLLYTNFIELLVLETSGILYLKKHQVHTGVEPMVMMMMMMSRYILYLREEVFLAPYMHCLNFFTSSVSRLS